MEAIIAIAIQLFLSMFKGGGLCPSPPEPGETVKEYLQDRYDEETDRFDSPFVRSLRHKSRQAARKEARDAGRPRPRLNKREVDAITVAALRKGLETDDAEIAAQLAAAP